MNLQSQYIEEHAANAANITHLEAETSERMRLEHELSELKVLNWNIIIEYLLKQYEL